MAKFRLRIPGIPPSQNELHRMHFHTESKARKEWKDTVYLLAVDAKNRSGWVAPSETVRVKALFLFPDQARRDPDNYTASLKPVLDGLVAAGVLDDDDFRHVALSVEAYYGQRVSEIHLSIEDMDHEYE